MFSQCKTFLSTYVISHHTFCSSIPYTYTTVIKNELTIEQEYNFFYLKKVPFWHFNLPQIPSENTVVYIRTPSNTVPATLEFPQTLQTKRLVGANVLRKVEGKVFKPKTILFFLISNIIILNMKISKIFGFI